jgi:hypothetical protein
MRRRRRRRNRRRRRRRTHNIGRVCVLNYPPASSLDSLAIS